MGYLPEPFASAEALVEVLEAMLVSFCDSGEGDSTQLEVRARALVLKSRG